MTTVSARGGLQLSLALDVHQPDLQLIVTPANADIVATLERPDRWLAHTMVLAGPRKSGRSLHARLAATLGARVLDGADLRDEGELFAAWNRAQSTKEPLLLVAERAPPGWQPDLADLRSRLGAVSVATLRHPDDALADGLLEKLLLGRGIRSTPASRSAALTRLERTHLAIVRFVDALTPGQSLMRQGGGHHAQSLAA